MNVLDCISYSYPYYHYILNNCLDQNTINEVNYVIETLVPNKINDGERANNKQRYFVDKKNTFPNIQNLVDSFCSRNVVKFFEKTGKINLNNCYLRVEIIMDTKSFWLKKHKDIKEKLMSLLIYINDNNEPIENGTDIYDNELNHFRSIPFQHNTGFFFYPGDNTWHGLEKNKKIKKRKCILINYVTFKTDWKIEY